MRIRKVDVVAYGLMAVPASGFVGFMFLAGGVPAGLLSLAIITGGVCFGIGIILLGS